MLLLLLLLLLLMLLLLWSGLDACMEGGIGTDPAGLQVHQRCCRARSFVPACSVSDGPCVSLQGVVCKHLRVVLCG